MRVLALDVGSSSVKCALLESGRIKGTGGTRASYATDYRDGKAEVKPQDILRAIAQAIGEVPQACGADVVALCAMAPSWLAMDRNGRAITPVITHQDRRSVEVAQQIEQQVGKSRHLRMAGNRPFPGGISSTTAAWFARNRPGVLKRAALVGHLTTFLLRQWTGARVTDPSNASFMGVYRTTKLDGWSDELMEVVGLKREQMPDVLEANRVAGRLTKKAAAELGLREGMPVLPGIMDTSAAVLLNGAKNRTFFNVSGSTDVLALCVDEPRPHELLLTRAVGVGRRWMAVSTIASAGTTLGWLHAALFSEMSESQFHALVKEVLKDSSGAVRFEPYLAGDRLSIEQKQGAFTNLTLGATRREMLHAAIDALARESGNRIPLFKSVYRRISTDVCVGGGVGDALAAVLHRDWPGKWRFRQEKDATLRGLYVLAEMAKERD